MNNPNYQYAMPYPNQNFQPNQPNLDSPIYPNQNPLQPGQISDFEESYIENILRVNKGKKVSVQGTGMGQPSLSIYVNELFQFYNVQTAIRVGTCGAINKNIHVRDTILANSACTDSAIITQRFGNLHYAPSANFDLLYTAYNKAKENNINVAVGPCASSDLFYDDNSNWKKWAEYGVLGVEMEAAELYTLAAKYNRKALAILTVSDHIITGEQTTAEERQVTFKDMIKIALETAIN